MVRNLDLSGANSSVELEAHLLRIRSTEIHGVVLVSPESSWETRHSSLTSVKFVPDVVHHGIDGIVETSLLINNENRLNGSIPAVFIQVLKHQHADVICLTDVSLLCGLANAIRIGTTDCFIIRNDCEISDWGRRLDSFVS